MYLLHDLIYDLGVRYKLLSEYETKLKIIQENMTNRQEENF